MVGEYIYFTHNEIGRKYYTLDRQKAFEWYVENNGCHIERRTKDLFPKVLVMTDKKNDDIKNFKDNDVKNKTTRAKRKANAKYDKEHTKQICLKLNVETDKDILEFLQQNGKQSIIKELIRNEIKKKNFFLIFL